MGTVQLPARRLRRPSFQSPSVGPAAVALSRPALPLAASPVEGLAARSPWGLVVVGIGVLAVAEVLLTWQSGLRVWAWSATLLFSGAGAAMCVLAGQREGRFHLTWYAAAGGCLSLLLGFLFRGLQEYDTGGSALELAGGDSGFHGAVVFFLVAAVGLVRGDGAALSRFKLLLDVFILVITPFVAGLPIAERWGLDPDQQRTWSAALLYAASYAAMCYALVVATRRIAFVRPSSAEGTLTFAALALGLAAACHAARLAIPAYWDLGFGQTLWIVGTALAGLAGWRATRDVQPAFAVESQPEIGEDSRLRLLPAALAFVVVVLVPLQQAIVREPPSAALFFFSSSLFWFIVGRLLITLAENRSLVRGRQTADRSQLALRDLGVELSSSLEPERVYHHVCRAGCDALGASSAVLWLVSRDTHELVAVEVAGSRREGMLGRRLPLDDRHSLAARVARTRAPELIRHAAEARRSHQLLTVLRASQCLLAVPIRREYKDVLGVLVFSHTRDPVAFRPDDVARAELLANQAAVALRNAELFQEKSRALDEMLALYEYSRACDGASSSEEIGRGLLATLWSKIDFGLGTVLLADGGMLVSARGVVLRRLPGQAEPNWDVAPSRLSPLATRAFRRREAAHAARGDPDFRSQSAESVVKLAVPLTLRDVALGVVELESAQPDALGEGAERLVAALARHAALAIDNKRLEEDTREVATLKKLDRMKTELLGTVSHELRTPLAAIKGYATTLLEHKRMNPDVRREFLGIIDSESDRLQELISNLLDMSRLESGVLRVEPAPVQLGRLVGGAVARAQHQTDEHRLNLEWPSDPWVMADLPRVLQVVTNLLSNAIKYSPDGGAILVSGRVQGGMLQVSVSDSGEGIPPRELDKIFDRFHRVDGDLARRVSGTGLGLAICRGLVEAHRGRIWAESEPGTGSTFTFTLPICDPGEP